MSVSLQVPSSVIPINGIRISAVKAGLYAKDRLDLALFEISEGSVVTAVFTKNKFFAAPVQIARQHLNTSVPRYFLINSGNANAGNGKRGLDDAHNICQKLAGLMNCSNDEVLPFSTGVIGEKLPIDKINNALPELVGSLKADSWLDAAQSIMTTDTIPKLVSTKFNIDDSEINISGIAKGSGMIKPNMATMLSFIATDAKVSKKLLKQILHEAVNKSFNRISVDGDTSTNDACVLIATGKANHLTIENVSDPEYIKLKNALSRIFCKLAQAIVRDGEGATKYIEIDVKGGLHGDACLAVAYQIAHSPLVKTAFTASDPNWGRILAAVGSVNIRDIEIDKISIYLDDLCIIEAGQKHQAYTEESGKKIMLQDEIKITVDLGIGSENETIWTTDLSHEYIRINAEYRT